MGKLIYFTPVSLDGFIGDGNYDWGPAPDDEVMASINDLVRPIGAQLLGRRQHETMAVWQTPEVMPGLTPAAMEFAQIWQGADKIIYSKSLESLTFPKARLEREFDPQAVRDLKAKAPRDIMVGGPNLAAQAIRAGLVDEYHLMIVPFILGGGIRVLPGDISMNLELKDERRFGNGWVYLRYRTQV